MFTETFTIFGSSLSLLKPGEQGVVSRVKSTDEATVQALKAIGIVPGVTITLQQRSPAYTIAVGGDRSILCQKTADAIYVRLTVDSNSKKHSAEFAATQTKSACAD